MTIRQTVFVLLSTLLTVALAIAVNIATADPLPEGLVGLRSVIWPCLGILTAGTCGVALWQFKKGQAEPKPITSGRDPNHLPADVRSFVGRQDEMTILTRLLEPRSSRTPVCPVLAINGGPGVGKTTLVVHMAHTLSGRYRDGRVYLDLRGGVDPMSPSDALGELLLGLGVPAGALPDGRTERASLYQAKLRDARVLVVLDNAGSGDQVRPLLPIAPTCLMLIAGRRPLGVLPEAAHMMLDLMNPGEARELIASLVGAERVEVDEQAVATLIEQCGRLPLALGIAAARLRSRPQWTVGTLVARLSDERRRLLELRSGNVEVRSAFELSYGELTAEQSFVFRRLSLLFGTVISEGLAGAATDLPLERAATLLDELTDAQLLVAGTSTHYVMHELVRLYAAERAVAEEPADISQAVTTKALAFYVETMREANLVMGPPVAGSGERYTADDRVTWLNWFTEEHRSVLAGIRLAATREDHAVVITLAKALVPFLDMASYPREMRDVAELGVRAAQALGDSASLIISRHDLGDAYRYLGAKVSAVTELDQAIADAQDIGDELAEGRARFTLAQVYRELHQYEDAEAHYRLARTLLRASAAFCDDAEVLIGQADIRSARGLTDEASVLLEEALDQLRVFGRGTIQAEHKRAWAVENLGLVRRRQGRWRDAVELHTWSLSAFGELADRFGNAHAEANLGDAYSAGRKSQAALAHYQRALDLFTELNHPWGQAWVHKSLGELRVARRKWLDADQEFRRSHELYQLAGDVTRRREVLQTRAAALRHAGRPEDAATCEREEAGLSDPASEGSAKG